MFIKIISFITSRKHTNHIDWANIVSLDLIEHEEQSVWILSIWKDIMNELTESTRIFSMDIANDFFLSSIINFKSKSIVWQFRVSYFAQHIFSIIPTSDLYGG